MALHIYDTIKHKLYRLPVGIEKKIGRGSDNDLIAPAAYVSRHHATVTAHEDDTATVRDRESKNGTFMNNYSQKVSLEGTVVHPGDEIILGKPSQEKDPSYVLKLMREKEEAELE